MALIHVSMFQDAAAIYTAQPQYAPLCRVLPVPFNPHDASALAAVTAHHA